MPPYRINEIVWAKIKGYPHWPARVLDPAEGANVKVNRKKNMYFVRFFAADERAQQVSWIPEEELFEYSDKLAEMKQAADVKGGKTYTDLRKCIDVASQAHQDYVEDVEKHPDLAMKLGLVPSAHMEPQSAPTASTDGTPGGGRGKQKGAKKEPATPATPAAPRSPRGQAAKTVAAASAAPIPEPTAAEPSPSPSRRPARGPKADQAKAAPAAAGDEEESGGPGPVMGKRVSKKRALPDESPAPAVNGGSARKKATPAARQAPFKNPLATPQGKNSGAPSTTPYAGPSAATLKQAKEITVGFIGLEDSRAAQAAKELLSKGVTVRVWAKTTGLAKDLEYSGADRINEAEKIFEEADIVFMTAGSGHDLNALLSGADHLARKIRPVGKNKVKGVCVFSSMSKQDR